MPEYIPTWRRTIRKRARRIPAPIFGALSVICLALLWIPSMVAYPISNQLAEGNRIAWAMFLLCGIVILLLAATMVKAERFFSMLFLLGVMATMGYIASSDPNSLNHLSAFIMVSLALCGWMFWMANDLDDGGLRWCAIGAAAGILASFGSLGIGERILITSSLAFVNVAYYGHLHPGR